VNGSVLVPSELVRADGQPRQRSLASGHQSGSTGAGHFAMVVLQQPTQPLLTRDGVHTMPATSRRRSSLAPAACCPAPGAGRVRCDSGRMGRDGACIVAWRSPSCIGPLVFAAHVPGNTRLGECLAEERLRLACPDVRSSAGGSVRRAEEGASLLPLEAVQGLYARSRVRGPASAARYR